MGAGLSLLGVSIADVPAHATRDAPMDAFALDGGSPACDDHDDDGTIIVV